MFQLYFSGFALSVLLFSCGQSSRFTADSRVGGSSNDATTCSQNLMALKDGPIEKAACSEEAPSEFDCQLTADRDEILQGQSIQVTLKSSQTNVDSSKINGVTVSPGTPAAFTPTTVGPFKFSGLVQKDFSFANCSAVVEVKAPLTPKETPPSCVLTAARENNLSTQCNVNITSTGGPVSDPPTLAGASRLLQIPNGWQSVVTCPADGVEVKANLQNSGGVGSCSQQVQAIASPVCRITVDRKDIEVGQTVNATLRSLGGPVATSLINNVAVTLDQPTKFTPPSAGKFILMGTLKNPRSNETCSIEVDVKDKPQQPVASKSCSLGATRLTPSSTKCQVVISPTGGALDDPPTLQGGGVLSKSGANWIGQVDCTAGGQTITATVLNQAGPTSCTANVPAIPEPACRLDVDRASVTLGEEVSVTIQSSGGPVDSSLINSAPATLGLALKLKPVSVGSFDINGSVQNPRATKTCVVSVKVNPAPPPVCTINTTYKPESIACNINVKANNSIWMKVSGWDSLVKNFQDTSASFISPLSTVNDGGVIKCPLVQEDLLVYVSHIKLTQAGQYRVESIIDDVGSVRFWKDGDPYRESIVSGNASGKINLDAGNYVVVVDAKDKGKAATGMAFSMKNNTNQVVHRSHSAVNRDDSWCIFRTSANNTNLKTFVPDAARCRKCFGAP